jgi:adhesin HecA-like repeat protein
LSTIFGVIILFVGIIAIALASGMNGSKESSSTSETAKDEETAPTSKAKDNSSKSESKAAKTSNEREKLKIKGLYIGMQSDQVLAAITPAINQLSSTQALEIDGENILNSAGQIISKAVLSCKYGQDAWLTAVATGSSRGDVVDKILRGDLLFYCVSRREGGEVESIAFPKGRIFNLNVKGKEFVQLFVNSYKLAAISPMALLGNKETDSRWICDFPFGVNVEISKAEGSVFLAKVPSDSEKAQEKAKQINDAKKGFN